uniref:Uncharacterized protein n=1 Tax=Vespula pensylvanica TaxID=30213 RepID=A0A834JJ41_VESPE|nr:hypothetical protein H0235_018182 [Vespula pensylvanica]
MWGCILAHWADEQIRHDVPVDYVQAHVGPPNFGVLCTEEWKEKIRIRWDHARWPMGYRTEEPIMRPLEHP